MFLPVFNSKLNSLWVTKCRAVFLCVSHCTQPVAEHVYFWWSYTCVCMCVLLSHWHCAGRKMLRAVVLVSLETCCCARAFKKEFASAIAIHFESMFTIRNWLWHFLNQSARSRCFVLYCSFTAGTFCVKSVWRLDKLENITKIQF